MYHIFIYSSVDRHLVCLHILATVNNASVIVVVHVYIFEFWLSPVICQGMELLCDMLVLFLVFFRSLHTVLCSGYPDFQFHQQHLLFVDFLVM